MSYFPSITQTVLTDANNSSNTNLAQNAFFIGLPTSTLGVAAIQIAFKSDQNCTIFVDQSQGLTAGIGTATVSNGSPTITGSGGTKFTRDFKVGDQIFVGGETTHYILSITSDTVMTATASFLSTGGGYTFYPWDQTDQYAYNATTDNFGLTIQAVNTYERVRVTNIGSGLSLVFRLTTVLCPIVEAVPRSLDENGNLKVNSPTDTYNWSVENTPQGDTRSVTPIRLAGAALEGSTLDTNFWGTILINGGTITQANARLNVLTGASANGSATIFTIRKGRYVSGSTNCVRIQGRFGDTGTTDNVRQFGAGLSSNYTLTIGSATIIAGDVYTDVSGVQYTILISGTVTTATVFATGTPTAGAGQVYTRVSGTGAASFTGSAYTINSTLTDGFYFQLSGTTFSVVTAIGGTPTPVNSGLFNGNLGASYTPTINVQTWEIYYNTKTVYFTINGKLLHTVSDPITPLSNTNTLHAFIRNTNSNNLASSLGFYARSVSIRRLGPLETERTFKYVATNTTTVLKYSAGRLYKVIFGDPETAQVVTLYDGLTVSAPLIATLTNVKIDGNHTVNHTVVDFTIPFHNGLTMVTSSSVPITIIYE